MCEFAWSMQPALIQRPWVRIPIEALRNVYFFGEGSHFLLTNPKGRSRFVTSLTVWLL